MLKIVIVDDEFKSRELVKVLLQSCCPDIDIVGLAGNVKDSIALIKNTSPDLVLLDVELGVETSFNLLQQLPAISFDIIFTTAHSHYALQAIKFSAIDYLLKPIDPQELKQAVEKVRARQEQVYFSKKVNVLLQNLQATTSIQQKVALPTSDGYIFVPIDEIIYCEADGAYTTIFTQDGSKRLVSKNIKEYEAMLESNHFFRVHNSYLINLNRITKYVKGEGGYVVMSNQTSIDVSKRRKDAFLAAIARH
ncbi:MAG: hypothetical protein AVDCRST_MAG95-2933 [uncultured Adhaeribacter sp.]|uniref:Two-component transcriptional response regulator, LuxR family n=1 Tax=uncultured Adhaeribacter sp. TaxID=448109 RepID=A0A6J4J9P2_9BACT|nr:MAG: hypothetical protein AVDCRST_MAG95-2933 [uncultured Adhaeribacter sp.]